MKKDNTIQIIDISIRILIFILCILLTVIYINSIKSLDSYESNSNVIVRNNYYIVPLKVNDEITVTEEEYELMQEIKEEHIDTEYNIANIDWVANRTIDISAEEYFIFARLVYLENGKWNGYECTYLTGSVIVNRLDEYGSFYNVAFADNQYTTAQEIYNSYDMNEKTINAIEDAYNNPVKGIYYQCMGHLFDEYYELYKEVDGECFYYGGE